MFPPKRLYWPQAVPLLVVLGHPDGLHAVALAGVVLTEDEEIIGLPGEEAAPLGQLEGDGPAGLELEGIGVLLHDDGAGLLAQGLDELHTGQAVPVVVQVGLDGGVAGGLGMGVGVAVIGLRRLPRRLGGGAQGGPPFLKTLFDFFLIRRMYAQPVGLIGIPGPLPVAADMGEVLVGLLLGKELLELKHIGIGQLVLNALLILRLLPEQLRLSAGLLYHPLPVQLLLVQADQSAP